MSTRKITLGKAPKGMEQKEKAFWTIPANTKVIAKVLVDIEHVVEGFFCQYGDKLWAYCGDDDPCHKLGIEPRFSILLPCIVKIGNTKELKVIRGPQGLSKQIEALAITKDLRGLLIELQRKDDKWARYTVTPTGQRATVEEDQDQLVQDILSKIKQGTSAEIAAWLGINTKVEEEDL